MVPVYLGLVRLGLMRLMHVWVMHSYMMRPVMRSMMHPHVMCPAAMSVMDTRMMRMVAAHLLFFLLLTLRPCIGRPSSDEVLDKHGAVSQGAGGRLLNVLNDVGVTISVPSPGREPIRECN